MQVLVKAAAALGAWAALEVSEPLPVAAALPAVTEAE